MPMAPIKLEAGAAPGVNGTSSMSSSVDGGLVIRVGAEFIVGGFANKDAALTAGAAGSTGTGAAGVVVAGAIVEIGVVVTGGGLAVAAGATGSAGGLANRAAGVVVVTALGVGLGLVDGLANKVAAEGAETTGTNGDAAGGFGKVDASLCARPTAPGGRGTNGLDGPTGAALGGTPFTAGDVG